MTRVGVVGLGNMGSALAANLVTRGHTVVAYDAAGPRLNVDGARFASDLSILATSAEVVVFSLPDGSACESVARQLAAVPDGLVGHVIETSTIGPRAAQTVESLLGQAEIGYVDAPVSGGPAGVRARTLVIMVAGADPALDGVGPILNDLSDCVLRVGDRPGMGQAVKLANNFLSATALVATSEAVAFGVSAGVDMAVLLEVLDSGSGRNTATSDKFPNQVLTGHFASGFSNSLMAKDVSLYLREVNQQGDPEVLANLTTAVWQAFHEAEPDVDFTRIYPHLLGRASSDQSPE